MLEFTTLIKGGCECLKVKSNGCALRSTMKNIKAQLLPVFRDEWIPNLESHLPVDRAVMVGYRKFGNRIVEKPHAGVERKILLDLSKALIISKSGIQPF